MRIIVPYTDLRCEVVEALNASGLGWEAWNVSASDEAYWHLLASLWAAEDPFCIVEHDVLVRPGTLDELAACESPWCAFQVPYVGQVYAGLSCAKFSGELIARHPDAIQQIGTYSEPGHPSRHWCRLDSWLQGHVLNPAGEKMCVHTPPLEHCRDHGVPSHGCSE